MSCNPNTLLTTGKSFQSLSERDQQLIIAELLCEISVTTAGVAAVWVAVFPDGSAFGPGGIINTSGTTTSGIQEAIDSLPVEASYAGPTSGGGTILLAKGRFDCTSQITIPNNYPYNLTIKGSGKMCTLVNYNSATVQDFVVTQRSGNPGDSAGYPSLNLAIHDCAFTYATTANKAAIFKLTEVNECLVVNCAFATLESFSVPGFGASLVYIDGTPATKPGVVGFALDSVAPGNIAAFEHCAFYGLACGLDISTDHVRVEHTIFANIGIYWVGGRGGVQTAGTQWAVVTGADNLTIRRQNCYANGMALVRNGGVWEMDVHYCQWFYCNITFGIWSDQFCNAFVLHPMIESTTKGLVSIGANASQAVGDTGLGVVSIFGASISAYPAGGYMNSLTGTISGTNPLFFSTLALVPALPDAEGVATSLSYANVNGTVFSVNNNGAVLRNMTKAARNALTAISIGQAVYQTDNTPGQRVWNGTHWVRYTETNDD